ASDLYMEGIEYRDRGTSVDESYGASVSHGACADGADAVDLPHRCIGVHIGNLGCGALGKERATQRTGFGRGHEAEEEFALGLEAFIERAPDTGGNGLDAFQGSRKMAGRCRHRIARELEQGLRRW